MNAESLLAEERKFWQQQQQQQRRPTRGGSSSGNGSGFFPEDNSRAETESLKRPLEQANKDAADAQLATAAARTDAAAYRAMATELANNAGPSSAATGGSSEADARKRPRTVAEAAAAGASSSFEVEDDDEGDMMRAMRQAVAASNEPGPSAAASTAILPDEMRTLVHCNVNDALILLNGELVRWAYPECVLRTISGRSVVLPSIELSGVVSAALDELQRRLATRGREFGNEFVNRLQENIMGCTGRNQYALQRGVLQCHLFARCCKARVDTKSLRMLTVQLSTRRDQPIEPCLLAALCCGWPAALHVAAKWEHPQPNQGKGAKGMSAGALAKKWERQIADELDPTLSAGAPSLRRSIWHAAPPPNTAGQLSSPAA